MTQSTLTPLCLLSCMEERYCHEGKFKGFLKVTYNKRIFWSTKCTCVIFVHHLEEYKQNLMFNTYSPVQQILSIYPVSGSILGTVNTKVGKTDVGDRQYTRKG